MIVIEQVKPTVMHALEKGNLYVEFEPITRELVRVREYDGHRFLSLNYVPTAKARDLYRWLKDTEGYTAW